MRVGKPAYAPGADILVRFTNGPANPKDRIAIYKAGQTPGTSTPPTTFAYVDGTKTGTTGLSDGTITFAKGLPTGNYVAYLLEKDGYTALASEGFSVVTPIPDKPRLLSITPANDATNLPPIVQFSATIINGTAKVAVPSIALLVDGQAVTPSVTTVDGNVTVAHANSALFPPGSSHTYKLSFKDNATPAGNYVFEGAFTVAMYKNIQLPAPLVFENFDGTPEGGLPAGWTQKSYSEVGNVDPDLGNLDSASYSTWIVVNADRFMGTFVAYGNPARVITDYQRVLTPNPLNVVNGRVVTGPLASGRFLFGDSGYRNGRSQVLFVTTPDFNLAGKTDIHVVFHSLYEQNQDSMGALEYSINGGVNWLPAAYFLDGPDVARNAAGEVDAEATFNTEGADVAHYTNENGTDIGGTYGAFISAPITPALAPFIHARVDDDPAESKRVEKFRLAQADNQKTVRLRFTYAGSDSWYWGVDDFGLYSLPVATPIHVVIGRNGDQVTLSWSGGPGGVLQSSPSLSAPNWQPVPGVAGTSTSLTPTEAQSFLRVVLP